MGTRVQRGPSHFFEQGSRFATTQWTLVLAAGQDSTTASREALATLCARYWYPLYAYVRRRGIGPDEAADLTQGFFAKLLEQGIVRGADRHRGKFRSYLLGAFKHYISHEWVRARAQKRGGGKKVVPLDPKDAEFRYGLEPAHDLTAERLFDRQWAVAVLEAALVELEQRYCEDGKGELFRRFKPFLSGGTGAGYRQAGAAVGLNEGAVRVLVHRLRRRYRQILRDHIGRTVETPELVEEEIQHLFEAIGG
jgi:DNA-directed RNA polymerase specialized sigma24 family protein